MDPKRGIDLARPFLVDAMEKVSNESAISSRKPRPPRPNSWSSRACNSTAYLSPYFVANQDKMRVEFEDPYILIHEKKLSNLQPCCR
ncbi:chaperonin GroEL [Rhizobium aethiopicum]|uniref:Chaperonin GroEL n=1 Tax=Rhizobium aethiopicum TaxID=1138170 RepID=A0A7W6QBM0_9HYPH|nr:chaperonin GroEL domain-containing protein [Rhizobium sp. TAL182]KEC70716.1 heat shock protein 60 family chaperone GroEL [Rhizobium leguminosarum bv. phaseoli CCGM1]MBB4194560.1 chaperonin GroEL [Rhizobium aethiopicum]MBB4582267.1 chaperonin GroEL [Rhizobium aethiopicum]PON05112.1 hypothetical protein ATY29_23315 [Rhizobium hidalgonense]